MEIALPVRLTATITAGLPGYQLVPSNYPGSHFVTGLIAARPVLGKRYALLNNELKIHHLDGETVREALTSASELTEVLEHTFQVTLPKHTSLNSELAKLCTRKDEAP